MIGIAKKESSRYCKQTGDAPVGGLWATGTKCLPVEGSSHFRFTKGYILDHVKKGAAIWEPPQLPGLESFDPDSLLLD